jgi:hypothetical protein
MKKRSEEAEEEPKKKPKTSGSEKRHEVAFKDEVPLERFKWAEKNENEYHKCLLMHLGHFRVKNGHNEPLDPHLDYHTLEQMIVDEPVGNSMNGKAVRDWLVKKKQSEHPTGLVPPHGQPGSPPTSPPPSPPASPPSGKPTGTASSPPPSASPASPQPADPKLAHKPTVRPQASPPKGPPVFGSPQPSGPIDDKTKQKMERALKKE